MRYLHKGQTLLIDLENNYEVLVSARYNKHDNCYQVELYIHMKTVDIYDKIEDKMILHCEQKELFYSLTSMIEEKFKANYFDAYIERYQFYIKCMEYGIDAIDGGKKVLNRGDSDV